MSHPLPDPADAAPQPIGSRWRGLHEAMLDIVLAGGDLERVVALAAEDTGGTVAVVVPPAGLAVAWPPRDDAAVATLRRYASQRLSGDPAPVPDGLELELPVASGGDELGLVALLDTPGPPPSARRRAAAGEILHLTAATTIVALAVDGSAFGDDRLGAGLLAALLDDEVALPEAEILARARRAGSDLSAGAVACCGRHGELPHRLEAALRGAFPGALVLQRGDSSYALLPAGADDRHGTRTTGAALDLARRLGPAVPFAIAPFEPAIERLGAALREAELAAGAVIHGATPEDLHSGTYRLLVRLAGEHPHEVERFTAATVGPIVGYDAEHRTDVVATLQAYLDRNCNMNATAAAIYAHRHTVAYRLERVRELTGLDPLDHADREQLCIGLKAHALLEAPRRR